MSKNLTPKQALNELADYAKLCQEKTYIRPGQGIMPSIPDMVAAGFVLGRFEERGETNVSWSVVTSGYVSLETTTTSVLIGGGEITASDKKSKGKKP